MTAVRMNLTMSTKLSDLLNKDGQIPDELSSRGRNLINFLGEIVASVSGSRELRCSDPIQCRKYISKKRCAGDIAAWCRDKNDQSPIEWCCLECEEGGIIYNWQGSQFDQKELRLKREYDHICKGVWLNGQRLDEIQMTLQPQPGYIGAAYLSYPSHRIVVRNCEERVVQLGVPPLLAVELFRREIISPRGGSVAVKLGKNESKTCSFTGVKYPNHSGGVVELEFSLEVGA